VALHEPDALADALRLDFDGNRRRLARERGSMGAGLRAERREENERGHGRAPAAHATKTRQEDPHGAHCISMSIWIASIPLCAQRSSASPPGAPETPIAAIVDPPASIGTPPPIGI